MYLRTSDESVGIDELQVAEVDLIEDIICDELLKPRHSRKWDGLSDHQMCAGFLDGGTDTCHVRFFYYYLFCWPLLAYAQQ